MGKLGIEENDAVELTLNGRKVITPVLMSPGASERRGDRAPRLSAAVPRAAVWRRVWASMPTRCGRRMRMLVG